MHLDAGDIERKTFPLARKGYDPEYVTAFLKVVADEVRASVRRESEALEAARAAATDSVADEPSPAHFGFEKIARQVATILTSAAEAAEELKANADEEVIALQQAASEQASQIVRAAADEAAALKASASGLFGDAEAARLRADQEAQLIEQQARDKAAAIERIAQLDAGNYERSVHAKVDDFLEESRTRYGRLRDAQHRCLKSLASIENVARRAQEEIPESERSVLEDRPDPFEDDPPLLRSTFATHVGEFDRGDSTGDLGSPRRPVRSTNRPSRRSRTAPPGEAI